MTRHTTFRYCLDPTSEQRSVLVRHAGASRLAFNQCLRVVKDALSAPTSASDKVVPWSGFDLINAFNSWKKTDAAPRTFAVDTDGVIEIRVTGLAWRTEVCQQVFEEAAVDCGRALAAWADSRVGNGRAVASGFLASSRRTRAGRWWVSLNVEVAELHSAHRHRAGRRATTVAGSVSIEDCRRHGCGGGPLVPIEPDMFAMPGTQQQTDTGGSSLHLSCGT
jgi:hypothetical protein